ncbi:hypothetical protein NC651_023189 [Populus alba x Populus x berolinensis]|nr:hypothetical protein NC651_023178 [Populus alba x Populus x berolinensis]KAJ6897237.1 hypothetical protein NC651_023184 [Populus alba x Populus x berolinensis]KAJ6897244.1 hypothetical protein NC651_023189 [Populus alba x Populus x berolinensis]
MGDENHNLNLKQDFYGQTNEDEDLINLNIIMDRANRNKVVEDVNGMIAMDNENHELICFKANTHKVVQDATKAVVWTS